MKANSAHPYRALVRAMEEDRRRIARDLHDQIGQALSAVLFGLDLQLERHDPAALIELRQHVMDALSDVRRVALDMRPSALDELGLAAAVRRCAREHHRCFGLEVQVFVDLPTQLGRDEETVLYRVVQEALTNVARHARARAVSIVATARQGWVQLVVEDDGVGFDPAAPASAERLGLVGMRERLELFGGSLRIESAPGAGCSVHARLPLP